MEQQAYFYPLNQGEILYILVLRARKRDIDTGQVARALGVRAESLPRMYKSEKLTKRIIMNAANLFNVPPTLFTERPTFRQLSERMDILEASLRAEIDHLRDENELLKRQNELLDNRIKILESENNPLRAMLN